MSTRTGRPAATSVSSARSGKRFPMSLGRLLPFLAPAPLVGGKAVMEGVMMRNGDVYALAVRTADGNISVENRPWFSLTRSEPVSYTHLDVYKRQAHYVGMIGSKRKRDGIYSFLRSEGFSEDDFGRVHSPIGLEIGAETPEEIAVSIVAELIAARRGLV